MNAKIKVGFRISSALLLFSVISLLYFLQTKSPDSTISHENVSSYLRQNFTPLLNDYLIETDAFFTDSTVFNAFWNKTVPIKTMIEQKGLVQFVVMNNRGTPIDWTFLRNDLLKEIKQKYLTKSIRGFVVRLSEASYLVSVKPIIHNRINYGLMVSYVILDYYNPYFPSSAVPESFTSKLSKEFNLTEIPDVVFSKSGLSDSKLPFFVSALFEDSLIVSLTPDQVAEISDNHTKIYLTYLSLFGSIAFVSFLIFLSLFLNQKNYSKNTSLFIIFFVGIFFMVISYFLELEMNFIPPQLGTKLQYLSDQTFGVLQSFSDLIYLTISVLFLGVLLVGSKITTSVEKPKRNTFFLWFIFSSFFLSLIYNLAVIILQAIHFDGIISTIPAEILFGSETFFTLFIIIGLITGLYLLLIYTYKIYRFYLLEKLTLFNWLFILTSGLLGFIPVSYYLTKPSNLIWYFLLTAYLVHYLTILAAQYRDFRFKFANGNYLQYSMILCQTFFPFFLIYLSQTDERLNSIQQNVAIALSNPKDGLVNFASGETISMASKDSVLISGLTNGALDEDYAYNLWLKSLISREKFAVRLKIYQSDLTTVSEWSFGNISLPDSISDKYLLDMLKNGKNKNGVPVSTVQNDKSGNYQFSRYVSSIVGAGDSVLGAVSIDVINPKSSLTTENQYLLRTDENHLTKYNFDIAVYKSGKLNEAYIVSNFPPFLSDEVMSQIAKNRSYWLDRFYNEKQIRFYFYKPSEAGTDIITVARPLMTLTNWWNQISEFVIYIIIVFCLLYFGIQFVGFIKYGRFSLSFKERVFSGLLAASFIAFWLLIFFFDRTFKEHGISTSKVLLDNYYQGMISQIGDQIEEREIRNKVVAQDYLIYKNAQILFTSRPEWIRFNLMPEWLPNKLYREFINSPTASTYGEYKVEANDFLVGYYQIRNSRNEQFTVGIPNLISKRKIDDEIAKAKSYLISGYVFFLVVLVSFLTLWANWLLKPIQIIEKAFGKIGRQKEPQLLSIKGIPEIEQFSNSFNAMVEDLKNYRENLTKAERQLAWQEMAKQVAHEIKNPLTPLKLNSQLLMSQHKSNHQSFDQNFEKIMALIVAEIDKIDKIAKTFSSFSKMPERSPEPLLIHDLISDVTELYQIEHVSIIREQIGDPLYLLGDREELSRVFSNIIKNAIQAKKNESAEIKISVEYSNGLVRVLVTDYGIGIPSELLDKVLEPNFSTKTDGMGLGLAICKKIIQDMHGTFKLTSEVNNFTTVEIVIPAIQ